MNQYQKDYNTSLAAEQAVEQHLKTRYKLLTENSSSLGYFPYWDISTTATSHNNRVITFEVKVNAKYKQDTVVVEAGKFVNKEWVPCGTSISTADYYLFVIDGKYYIIALDILKGLITNNKNPKKNIIYDKNNYQLHIFNKEWFLSQCKII